MIDEQKLKVKNGSTWHTVCPIPVGGLYLSFSSTSPSSIWGGTWTAITGRFLYANAGTGTGGSNTQTLSVANLPNINGYLGIRGGADAFIATYSSGGGVFKLDGYSGSCYIFQQTGGLYQGYGGFTMNFGSGTAHNNMPAYQSVYCWRRTA